MSSLAGDSIKRNEFWRKFSELCGHWDDESTKKENLTEKNQFIRCSCCFKSLKKTKEEENILVKNAAGGPQQDPPGLCQWKRRWYKQNIRLLHCVWHIERKNLRFGPQTKMADLQNPHLFCPEAKKKCQNLLDAALLFCPLMPPGTFVAYLERSGISKILQLFGVIVLCGQNVSCSFPLTAGSQFLNFFQNFKKHFAWSETKNRRMKRMKPPGDQQNKKRKWKIGCDWFVLFKRFSVSKLCSTFRT